MPLAGRIGIGHDPAPCEEDSLRTGHETAAQGHHQLAIAVCIGVFGVSKGGSVALAVAAEEPFVRCVVTDGAYATRTTVIPFIRRWASIYVKKTPAWVRRAAPDAIYGLFSDEMRRQVVYGGAEVSRRR